jgi:TonB-linked SusC/RagA family outer membrane protein
MRKFNEIRNLLFLGVFMLCGSMYAQSVSGTISDANGPLPGANVIVKGTTNGVTTDFDGNYTITDVGADAVLSISFIGYISQEVSVGGQSTINVTLEEEANQLSEVVVVGYSSQTRGDITGSVSSVDMSEAVKVPVANAAEALQGRVTGVTVTNSGAPGAAPKIAIRGFGTSNNTNPLFIIDGVQTDDANIFNSIDPNDIDQMNVLKDGAAAIYGARASNGVIIVTTKSGGYNMTNATLSLDVYTGISEAFNTPDLLNAQQHGEMIFESLRNDGAVVTHPQYGSGASPVVPAQLLGVPVPATVKSPNGTYWPDAMLQSAPTTNVSLSLQNGTESGKYFMSAGYLKRDGILKYTGFERATTRLNSEFKIKDRVRVGEHLNIAFSNGNSGNAEAFENSLRSSPLIPAYDDEGNFG